MERFAGRHLGRAGAGVEQAGTVGAGCADHRDTQRPTADDHIRSASAGFARPHERELLLDVSEQNPQTGALEVPVDKLRQLRQTWDGVAALAKHYQGAVLADYAAGEVHGMAADAIREQLGAQFPDIDALNKEYSFWKNAEKIVSDTITRRQGQAKPLGQKLAQAAGTAAGYATGGMGGAVLGREAMGALEKLTTSTAWGTVSAVMRSKLADAIASGDTSAIIDLATRLGASGAVQASEEEQAPAPYRQAVSQRAP